MRRIVLFASAALLVACRTTFSAEFPAKATYLFYVQGVPAGKSEIECVQKDGVYVFSSTSNVVHGEFAETLSCRTEFDQKTLRPRLFQYKGVLSGDSLSGTIRVDGDSAFSDLKIGANSFSVRVPWADPKLIFQNYVPEHLIVLAHHLAASEALVQRFTILFPSDMMFVPGAAEVASEVELATRPSPVVCKKILVAFQSSLPFYLYVDRKRNLPVYMDFPGVQTEMFLQSAYGDHPGTKYAPPEEPGTQR